MSELLNRIVERLAALDGSKQAGGVTSEQRERIVAAAISLFYATGGDVDELKKIVARADSRKSVAVADAIAQIVVAAAAVSCASDLDMVQAAYNWIDNPPLSLSGRASSISVDL